MTVTLDRETFKKLVKLNLWLLPVSLGVLAYDVFSPAWWGFSTEFDSLVARHFGTLSDASWIAIGPIVFGCLIWTVASMVGLLRFKRWARWGYWASMLLFLPVSLIPGLYPSYTTPWSEALVGLGWMLSGAILLLAYSRDHGAIWFAGPAQLEKDSSDA